MNYHHLWLATGVALGIVEASSAATVELKAQAFRLQDVKVLDSPFKQASDADAAYLLKLEPDRLLSRFREYAGLKPKGAAYGGWEQESLSGHTLGHYLSACSLMYAATGDGRFKERVGYVVDELEICQNAHGDGFVAGFPDGRKAFQEVAAGNIRARPFNLNGIWSPFYTLHKLFAGLRDAGRLCENPKALSVEKRLANWVEKTLSGLSESQMQEVLKCEFGGMNEVLADLYADTGDARYLALARRFHHQAVLGPLARGEDVLKGLHANTQIPKITGTARLFVLTGEPSDRAAAEFFWNRVVHHHSYVTGGNSESEYFGPPDQLSDRLSDRTTETCNTYNLLRLTRLLFQTEPRAEYADYYERALYNHILASQEPASGMVTYFVPLRGGFAKTFTTPFDTFTCCLGTGLENHAKYGDSIYYHGRDALYVNLFIPSELTWKEQGLVLRQETRFPDDTTVKLTLRCEKPVELALRVRCPHWAGDRMSIRVNGERVSAPGRPGRFIEVRHTWQDGDRVDIQLPMSLRLEAMPDNPRRVAIFHGPILLAGELGPPQDSAARNLDYVPVMLADATSLLERVKPVEGQPGTYRTETVGQPRDVTLRPFFRMQHARYAVYWDLLTPSQWTQRQKSYETERQQQRQMEALTVDSIVPGDTISERAHQFKGEKLEAEDFNGRLYRLSRGGWFSYELKALPDKPMSLGCTYWGGERPGSRIFDINVETETIATQSLSNDHPGEFFRVTYPVPERLTRGKQRVTVLFKAHPDKMAGGVFDLRMLKPPETVPTPEAKSNSVATPLSRDVTFIVTSDAHYDAFENEDRNERVRDTLRYLNSVTNLAWPGELGGGLILRPRAVLLLGDVIDDGDRVLLGKHQTPRQYRLFQADFGLDGTDGLLNFPVYESWGNHDGPPVGKEKFGFSFQAQLKQRNLIRQQKGWLANLSTNGLHYSWDWDDVHFVQLGIYPADRQHPQIKYSPVWHDPQGALSFLKDDLAKKVGGSRRPVVLMSHCGFDADWWHTNDMRAAYEAAKPYNVILYFYGHSGTGLRPWAPDAESQPLQCVNTGQTENGFFVVHISGNQVRLAYRIKRWIIEKQPDGRTKRTWDDTWEWKHLLEKSLSP